MDILTAFAHISVSNQYMNDGKDMSKCTVLMINILACIWWLLYLIIF